MWNLVNLGLAIPGYIKAKKTILSQAFTTCWKPSKTETVFLVNAGIDHYIGSGLLPEPSTKCRKKQSIFGLRKQYDSAGWFIAIRLDRIQCS